MKNKVRRSFDITPEMEERMGEIANELGISKAEVFRRAMALMDLSFEASKSGNHIGFVDDASKLDTVVAGIT